jgi:hypothetical protein
VKSGIGLTAWNTAKQSKAAARESATDGNTANGIAALTYNATGDFNTANGRSALENKESSP